MIHVRKLSFRYPNQPSESDVLHEIDLTIAEGEPLAIIGPNGSAKTTFARCLNGLLLPTAGDVLVDDLNTRDETKMAQIRRSVGMVFQNPENQIVSTTVEREIAFGLENLGVPHDEMHTIVNHVLEQFDLERYRNQPPHLLSGGEMQRLALASVTAMSPKYIIFDEPTSLLDPAGRRAILKMITELNKTGNSLSSNHTITPILITQYPEEALLCKRLIVMHDGRILLDDSPPHVFQQVDLLRSISIEAPVEFEVNHYLQILSDGRISLNTSDFLPIP